MHAIISILIMLLALLPTQPAVAQQAANVRLSKMVYRGNDFTAETRYEYDGLRRIKKIVYMQHGKLHYTISDFKFDEDGLVVSYIKAYHLKIAPQQSFIYYDERNLIKRIEIVRTVKSDQPDTVNIFTFQRDGSDLTVRSMSRTTRYKCDEQGNIKEIIFSTHGADPFLLDRYDSSPNPLLLTGGYVTEEPVSRNNNLWQQRGSNRYISTTAITYQKLAVHQHVPGGAKIPDLYKNGLPLQAVTSWYDPDAKRMLIIQTISYSYINSAP